MSVFSELHESGETHFHVPFLADRPFRCGVLKRKLADERIYVYFQTSHSYYWSALVYLSVPSPEKPTVDGNPFLSPGHPPVMDCLADIPRGANRTMKDKVIAWLGDKAKVSSAGKKSRCMERPEFADWLVKNELKTKSAAMAALSSMSGEAAEAAKQYMYRFSAKLEQVISFAWEMAGAAQVEEDQKKLVGTWSWKARSCRAHVPGDGFHCWRKRLLTRPSTFPLTSQRMSCRRRQRFVALSRSPFNMVLANFRIAFSTGPGTQARHLQLLPSSNFSGRSGLSSAQQAPAIFLCKL